jgi:hypothetical protein
MDHPSGRGDPLRGEDVTETLANVHVPGCSGVPPHMSARVAQAGAAEPDLWRALDGRGHLYGEVTVYDPPLRWATRGRVMPGTILDTDYRLREEAGAVVVSVTKVATGPVPRARHWGSAPGPSRAGSG